MCASTVMYCWNMIELKAKMIELTCHSNACTASCPLPTIGIWLWYHPAPCTCAWLCRPRTTDRLALARYSIEQPHTSEGISSWWCGCDLFRPLSAAIFAALEPSRHQPSIFFIFVQIWVQMPTFIVQARIAAPFFVWGLVQNLGIWAFYHTPSEKCQFR